MSSEKPIVHRDSTGMTTAYAIEDAKERIFALEKQVCAMSKALIHLLEADVRFGERISDELLDESFSGDSIACLEVIKEETR